MNRIDATRQLLACQIDCANLREINNKLRDKLLEWARNCQPCGGTGCETIRNDDGLTVAVLPCPKCHDIREVLEC